jgi:exopolysaccharide biosynthesis polyprenyl glycosylphosphotransferase
MTPGIITFVLIEIGSLFLVLSGIMFPWRDIFTFDWSNLVSFIGQAAVPPLCFFATFYGSDLYNVRVVRNLLEFRQRLFWPLLATFLLLVVLSPFILTPQFVGSSFLSSLVIVLIGTCVVLPLRWGLYTFGHLSPFAERILILGTGELAGKVATAIRALSPVGYTIAGFVADGGRELLESSTRTLSPVLGPLERVEQIIEQFRPDRIIVALRERRGRMPLPALLKAQWVGIIVEDGIKIHERLSGKFAIESLTPGFLLFSTNFRKPLFELASRRAVSLIIATVGLILTTPLFVIISLVIKLDSKGPIFFIQDRAGLNKRIFRLVKFRTMLSSPVDEDANSVWSRDVDSRVTRVGRWLRKTHLDELPQLFNILRGDMDLVGPRPEMADNIKTMEEQIPYYTLRMTVRPGVTGWAQIKHGYAVSQENVTEKTRYDLYYIEHRSLWLDLKILLDTAKLILLGQENSDSHPATNEKGYETVNKESKGDLAAAKTTRENQPVLGIQVTPEPGLRIDSARSSELS